MLKSTLPPVLGILILIGVLSTGCLFDEDKEDCWKDLGLQVARLDECAMPEQIQTNEPLTLTITASVVRSGYGEFSRIDIERTDHRITLTIRCNEFEWQCDSTMPPSDTSVLTLHEETLDPPFEPGELEIVFVQPSGENWTGVIQVDP